MSWRVSPNQLVVFGIVCLLLGDRVAGCLLIVLAVCPQVLISELEEHQVCVLDTLAVPLLMLAAR